MAIRGIYEPRGRAREYAPLAFELWNGCSHGCRYCYVPNAYHRERQDFHSQVRPRPGSLEILAKDARKRAGSATPVLFCFSCDPYQPAEVEARHTQRALEIMAEAEVPVHILTKGGLRATRDFRLLSRRGCAFGTTLVLSSDRLRQYWEPNAASVGDRQRAIGMAAAHGIPTFVSAEPILWPEEVLTLIVKTEDVTEWRFGRLNHERPPAPIDWRKWTPLLVEAALARGCKALVKESLSPFVPPRLRDKIVQPGDSWQGQKGQSDGVRAAE